MKIRQYLFLVTVSSILILTFSTIGQAQGNCEGTAERLRAIQKELAATQNVSDLQSIFQELGYITGTTCPDNGDAWYLRYKLGQRLNRPARELDNAIKQAGKFHSILLEKNIDPFGISRPPVTSITPPKDTKPPRIRIITPANSRGQKVVSVSRVSIEVEVSDDSGVRDVAIGGQSARLSSGATYSAEIELKPGENTVLVFASDIYGNMARESIIFHRDGASNSNSAIQPYVEGKYYALLIAVQDYSNGEIVQLDHPIGDAQRLRKVLESRYRFDSFKLVENPDRSTIFKSLYDMEEILTPNDHLLIFYAGHGHWDNAREQGYWLPSNATRNDRSGWISNADLCDSLRGLKARHILLITDACFSGGIFKTREAFTNAPRHINEISKLKSRNALTSGALTTVPDRSVFIRYLVDKLESNEEDYLLASDLFSLIRTPIINNSPQQSEGNIATPRYGIIQLTGDEGGDFIFVRRR